MSYILDALRKSEQQRRPGAASRPSGAVHSISIPMQGGGWLLVIGIILLAGILAAAFFFWRNTVNSAAVLTPEAAPVSTAPAVETLPATTTGKIAATPAAAITAPASNAEHASAVGDLADEARVPAHAKPKIKAKAKQNIKSPAAKAVTTSALAPQKNIPATPIASDHTPLLQQMPQEFQRALPPLAVSIHVYSQDASQRILFINNREYHVGDKINGTVRVEEIVPDGTVLSYQGERFKIARPR